LALLEALGTVGPANGYVIMQTVADELAGAWQPSPGAVYPALLGLEDAGLIRGTDRDGARIYELTARGRRALLDAAGTLGQVAARAKAAPPAPSLGRIVDDWAGQLSERGRRLDERQRDRLGVALATAQRLIEEAAGDG
jgi:DNA-binding PadR family transcriptional regulator